MAHIAIQKCGDHASIPGSLTEKLRTIKDEIRERAFSLFERRESGDGSDVDDWLRAERGVVSVPASELVEGEKDFQAQIALPGLEADDIQVSAMPDALVIEAESMHTHDGMDGNISFCEFSGQEIFRRLPLPGAIDVNRVSATLDKGILKITAPKAVKKTAAVAG